MKHVKFLLLFIMVWGVFYCVSAKAGNLWECTIHINERTDSFNKARSDAINVNRKIALENVISKLITLKDFNVVSKILDENSVYFFEDKIRLLNETNINNYYSVDITYYFNKDKILSFLKKNNIQYAINLNNKVLFIPFYNGKIVYNSSWYNLWEGIESEEYLTKVVLLDNLSRVDSTKIIEKDHNYLLTLQNEYQVDNIIIANLVDNNISSELQDPNDLSKSNGKYILSLNSLNEEPQNFEYINSLYEALKYTIGFSEEKAKNKVLNNVEENNVVAFKVQYNSFIDWVAIYNYIKQLPQVDLYISELDDKNIIIKIKYKGDLDYIVKNAANHNIIINVQDFSIACSGFCF